MVAAARPPPPPPIVVRVPGRGAPAPAGGAVRLRARAARPGEARTAGRSASTSSATRGGSEKLPRSLDGRLARGRARATRSRPAAADRVDLWRPVSGRRDLVLVDLRGTGGSAPLGCKAFSRPVSPLRGAGGPLRGADRPQARPLLHVAGRPGPRGGAPGPPRGEDRPLRGLVRHLRRAGLRAPLPGAAALAHARRRLPAAGNRSRPGPTWSRRSGSGSSSPAPAR